MVGDDGKLPLFHGNKIEDPKQYEFLCEAVWTVKQTKDYDFKKGQMVINFRGRALDWYMKFVEFPIETPAKNLIEIKIGLIDEFRNPISEAQYMTEIKEI